MNKEEAYKISEDLGYSYFFDEDPGTPVKDILDRIASHIKATGFLEGFSFWEERITAIDEILKQLNDEELTQIYKKTYVYGLYNGEAGRRFFENLLKEMNKAKEERLKG